MFTPATCPRAEVGSFSLRGFIERILVPEVAMHLIMDDLRCSEADALATLRASAAYGTSMFPDNEKLDDD